MKVRTIEGSSIDYLDHPRPITVEVDSNANARRYKRRSVENEGRVQSNKQVLYTKCQCINLSSPVLPCPCVQRRPRSEVHIDLEKDE